jgi:hypothetical protein
MKKICSLLHCGICQHPVIGPLIVQQIDCDTCISFDGRESEELTAIAEYRDAIQQQGIAAQQTCRHLGTKLKIAECCGQMYACKFHKGKKCAIVGIAKEPFLSCQTCPDFDSIDGITPTIIDRGRFAGRCVAVTSFSPNPERAERQALCLQSWRDIGLEVINVESDLKPQIKTLLDAGSATGLPFLLINADIEMHGDHTLIEAAIESPDKLTIGIRYNHAPDAPRGRSRKETAGLDAFLMTPKLAETVPNLPFTIGQPVWDYWLPYHFRSLGYAFHWIDSPLLFHATHEIQWSREDWVRGSAWLNDHYGVNLEYGSTTFRDGLNESLEVLI